mmetsp:Transcript_14833/g.30382  ORF Transcript_14833/g.30382 Transcript_14833/m.30382 type:complete len:283 (-) Transcript_14833:147-995(-)
MPFNQEFSRPLDTMLIDAYKQTGCFNWHCRAPNPSKRCGKCGVAVYCSRTCQIADWKDKDDPHKHLCQLYCNNTNPKDWKGAKGQQFPVPVGLRGIGLMLEDDLWEAMKNRASLFFDEVHRVIEANHESYREKEIGLILNVMYNFDKPILQGAVTFHDSNGPTLNGGTECVYYILFEPVGEGGEDVRRRIHPATGSGDLSVELRRGAIEVLKEFIQKVNEHGLHINLLTYQRGLMWMSDDDFRNGAAKELEEANGGNRIEWTPDVGYAIEDSLLAASTAAFG